MAHRIEIYTKVNDTRSKVLLEKLRNLSFPVIDSKVVDVYTINKDLKESELDKVAQMLANPVSQTYLLDDYNKDIKFNFAIEIGYLPGVTDNIGHTAQESIQDLIKSPFEETESVHSSQLIFLSGDLNKEKVREIGNELSNSLIQRLEIKTTAKFAEERGMDTVVPKVHLKSHSKADIVDLNIPEEDLLKLGKEGITDEDGTRRGPLALDKESLDTIKSYYEKEGRNPTDIEIESLAQTWSEHCKHTIFAAKIDENDEGLYKGFIKKATQDICNAAGNKNICVSVFKDNSGGIIFDDNWVVTDKAETHNSPSALDPFGGAITGIVGVNRDTIGFGMGAKPVINKYGFCVGNPDDKEPLYRDKELTNRTLSPRRILEGVVEGVNTGGNCSGIPTPQGFVFFDDRYKGKPLIFVGTVGMIPKEVNGKPGWEKKAKAGDKVVVIGGRVGQDGIHGATFSSEALSVGSPATAVQIGDPITQKKLSDAVVKEARDMDLYNSITDNGAGGISCSIAEMAKECGGCEVNLDKVPTKYPNLEPWKIWISESQERMTLAIPEVKLKAFMSLMKKRGVEATVVGEFNDGGRCVVHFKGEKIMDLDMNFLHDGLPKKSLKTSYTRKKHNEPEVEQPKDLTETLHEMLERPNLSSFKFISRQYDHEVQASSVIKPLQGPGEVNGNVSVTKPVLNSPKGVICSQALHPTYSDIDTYHMAACSIDEAIRNTISAGGKLSHLALMDNFCWCSSNEEERLGQLKATAQACYDYSTVYGTPFISGKDSMFNDFKGFDKEKQPIKISVPPTLLISSLGVMDDVTKSVSIDPKFTGDLIYIIGTTKEELGGSEYFYYLNELTKEKAIGNTIPKVDAKKAAGLYNAFSQATDKRLISSSISITRGGLVIALARKAISSQMGMEISLSKVPHENIDREDFLLFSETQTRFLVTTDPSKKEEFESHFKDFTFAHIGQINEDKNFVIKDFDDKDLIKSNINTLDEHYKNTFKNY